MLRLGIDYAKNQLHARIIDLGVFANNKSAEKCYKAVGFREYARRKYEMPIGIWDCIDMNLIIKE